MGRLDGKVALITGGARGQGRSHAVTFAREGAEIIVCDICAPVAGTEYPASTPDDLAETARQVEDLDRRCVATRADAGDIEAMRAVVEGGIQEFGHIDVLHVNHGVSHLGMWDATSEEVWATEIATNLTAAWRTTRLVIPHMIAQRAGSIIFTSSAGSISTYYGQTAYIAAKSGLVGLMRCLSAELAPHSIRVNAVAPGAVDTTMARNQTAFDIFSGHSDTTWDEVQQVYQSLGLLPTPCLDPSDISNAALFLASDEARYITGVNLPVDAGTVNQPPGIPPDTAAELASLRDRLANSNRSASSP
jgi:(+)-trans-carveol dehydrogenase